MSQAVPSGIATPGTPTVTIVIPTYGQADRLADAIASALEQTHLALDVLVMDDASPDDTPRVAESFGHDPRVRIVRHAKNLGRVANYRAGLELARGTWALVLDGDDALTDRGFIAAALERVARDPGIVLVVGGQRWRELEGGRYREHYPTRRSEEHLDGWEFFLRWSSPDQVVPHLGSLYRVDVARAIGFYTHDILSSDWESLRRLCLRGRVVLMRRLAGEWRGHRENVSRRPDPDLHLDNFASVLAPYRDARRCGRGGWRLEWWKWRSLQRLVAVYLETAMTRGDAAAVAEFQRGLRHRFGQATGLALAGACWLGRPSLWVKGGLGAIGGRRLLEMAQRVWHRWTWSWPSGRRP